MADRNSRPIVTLLVLTLLATGVVQQPIPVQAQAATCSNAISAGADMALLGGEELVWSFDAGQKGVNAFSPSYTGTGFAGTGDAVGQDADAYHFETLHMGGAIRHNNAPLVMPPEFSTALEGSKGSVLFMFSYVHNPSARQYLIDARADDPGDPTQGGFSIYEDIANKMWQEVETAGSTFRPSWHSNLPAGECLVHTFMTTWDNDARRIQIFLDGQRLLSTMITGQFDPLSQATLGAARDGTAPWLGRIDELRVYDRVLSDAEMMSLYNGVYCESACPDTVDPAVLGTLTGTAGHHGWYRSDVSLELRGADSGSGVKHIQYEVNGAPNIYNNVPLEFTAPGNYVVRFNATDNAGNTAPDRSIVFGIDKTPPEDMVWAEPQEGHQCIGNSCARTVPAGPTVIVGANIKRMQVDAFDPQSGIVQVILRLNGDFAGSDLEPPFVFDVQKPLISGPMELRAIVVNNAGTRGEIAQDIVWV